MSTSPGRKRKIIVIATLVASVVVPILICAGGYSLLTSGARSQFEQENIEQLRDVATFADAADGAGRLGVRLGTQDGPWAVIAYRDTHAGSVASSAVVKTSDGRWFRSSEHFCGRFAAYGHFRDGYFEVEVDELKEMLPRKYPDLWAIDHAATSDELARALEAMGFEPMDAP